ncbi:LysR family transcriptional regulator [Mycobacterium sp. KBS0706]|uniref:LysR substrate-binding domain-containing protein n=1 Tax=Mycobacterium sp. KBS0706 TaxID=2578109 RepID=UPI00110F913F|nr:LysR substrate-binding domain-containing protein [Mycobacterium sp. KBS0706]TSD90461.1 LysR family transcriptional regulator [Mycobacterium sp. KBS0706]
MEVKWLEDFLSLSATSSFSRSADERHVTQSALSRRIRQLETWIGVPLFDRTSYPVRLTLEGQDFLPRARKILDLVHQTRIDLRHRHDAAAETLTIATLNTLSLTFFPTWIRRLESQLGPLRTRFETRPTFAGLIATLLDGECDFLLTYAHESVPLMSDIAYCEHRCLGEERVIPVSSPDARGRPLHAIDSGTGPIQYLSYGTGSFFGHGLVKLFAGRPLPLAVVYENAMSAGLKAMALAGRGLAWIPESLIAEDLRSGALVRAGNPSWTLDVEIRLYRASAPRACADRFWSAIPDGRDEMPLPRRISAV